MRPQQEPPGTRVRARLKDRMALRDAMELARMNVRELAIACGKPQYQHTISHLHAGTRNTCSAHLARRIEEALRLPKFNLFLPFVTSVELVTADPKVTTRGRRKAA